MTLNVVRIADSSGGSAAGGGFIETHISGAFKGWSGETIFVMDNGQIWQQASYAYYYHYAYHPAATIVKTTAGYMLHVEDVDESLPIKRLK